MKKGVTDQMGYKGFAEQRAAHGMTQAALGEALGVSQTMVARIESGSKEPPVWLVRQAAMLLGCTTDALIFGSGGRAGERA